MLALLLAMPLALAPVAARAMCLWVPPPGELFTVPANGATDVPTDGRLWVLVGAGSVGTVVLDGQELIGTKEGMAWTSYGLPSIAPGKTSSYTVAICHDEGCDEPAQYGPYTFTVGQNPAAAPDPPELLEAKAGPTDGNDYTPAGDGSCLDQLMEQDCYDVGPMALYTFTLKPNSTASHFAVWRGEKKVSHTYFSTADCPVQIIAFCSAPEDSDECDYTAHTCFNVAAYNAAGLASEPVEMCVGEPPVEGEPAGVDLGGEGIAGDIGAVSADESSKKAGSGCGALAGTSTATSTVGVLFLLLAASLLMICRRRHGYQRRTEGEGAR